MSTRIRGVLAPVVTPFKEDLSPDSGRFVAHCRWLLSQNAGLAFFGTNSEANSLSLAERLGLMDALFDAGLPPSRMMPGVGCCAFPDTVELARKAVAAGCAGVLMLPPFFYKNFTDDGLFRSYSEIIQRVGDARLRVYLYHIPPVSQVPLGAALIERLLAAYPKTIAGIKDSSGDWKHTAMLLEKFQSEDFDVFCGSEVFLLQTLRGGGAGSITATGNVNPAMIHGLYARWRDADADSAQERITTIRRAFETLPTIAAMKCAIAWKRSDPPWREVRPPLMAIPAGQARALEERLAALGFDMPGIDN
ncbi:MAG: dihydrodipicolinate synthase family protein [Candidatus Accumulibacter sp.]|jgi:4-hydroxy-tetrahydrodipicolinate synthase|nr:dihydrodipicolinate synthase family protein [Accumulibacter sp.]